jgi:rubrerythrin
MKIPDPLAEEVMANSGLVPGLGKDGSEEVSAVERLIDEFESHEAQEREVVDRYMEVSKGSINPFVKFLLQLIIGDERKHYEVTHAMLSTLRGSLTWTRPKDAIPGMRELEDTEMLQLTEKFIQLEKEGIKQYKKLISESRGYYRDLFVLLFQSMIRDSEKHVEILEFLRRKVKEA